MNKDKLKGFFTGVLVMLALLALSAAAFAGIATRQITASYNDIKIYVDGTLIAPQDANGNPVEPFISEGTTYLPVRAVGEALGKEVAWDGETKSVYVGAQPASAATGTTEPPVDSSTAGSGTASSGSASAAATSGNLKRVSYQGLSFEYDTAYELLQEDGYLGIIFSEELGAEAGVFVSFTDNAGLTDAELAEVPNAPIDIMVNGGFVIETDTQITIQGVTAQKVTGTAEVDGINETIIIVAFRQDAYNYMFAFACQGDASAQAYTSAFEAIISSIQFD